MTSKIRAEPIYPDEHFRSPIKSYTNLGSPSKQHYERVSNSQMLSPSKTKTDEEITAFANSYKRYLKARVQGTSSI